ncbi:MAG: hypothetical protein V2A66_07550 [Pseudomonadota bacterium]
MTIAGFTGWLIVGVAIAAAICTRKNPRADDAAEPHVDVGASHKGPDEGEWCDAVETLCGAATFLFDSSLRLVAAGRRGRGMANGGAGSGAHLVDIVPPESAARFLEGAAAARRGRGSSWECAWGGRQMFCFSAPAGDCVLMTLEEKTC